MTASEPSETSTENGMSMTVPAKSIFVEGLISSTQVPGGYFSSKEGLSSQSKEQNSPPIIFHVSINQSWETIGVNAVGVRLVILLVPWIIDKKGI